MSEFEQERERLMDKEAPDLPFGRKPKEDSRRNLGLWVAGILLALAIPLFYLAFGLAGALVATGALPVILVVAGFFIAVLGLGGVYAYARLRARYDRRSVFHDDFGNRVQNSAELGRTRQLPPSVGAIMKRDVVVCGTLDSIYDCAKEMYTHNIGFLVVLDEHDRCVGVVTDRDLVCAGIAQGVDMKSTPVTTAMEAQVRFLAPRATLADCLRLMKGEGIRRVPVFEGTQLVGVVALDDLIVEGRISIDEAGAVLRQQLEEPNAHHGLKPNVA